MREILFRGQTRKNGEKVNILGERVPGRWVYGGVFPGKGSFSIIYGSDEEELEVADIEKHTVYTDTIGQYTGLNDKNGQRIFEGDIVRCIARLDQANCVVIFEEGEFRLVPERWYKTYTTGCGYHALRCFDKEVIGNIHDNVVEIDLTQKGDSAWKQ